MSNLLESATRYARRGWAVLPLHSIVDGHCTCGGANCGSPGKHPRTAHGCKDATRDLAVIQSWWARWPDANVGIATGGLSNLVVIDLDPRHGGFESARDLGQKHGMPPATPEVATGGCGLHLYYRHPGGRVPNSTSKLAAGIDVRGDGGFVVAPPSRHVSGNDYAWREGSPEEPPAMPQWLVELAIGKPDRKSDRPNDGEHWLAQALGRVAEGTRNDTGLWLACQLRDSGIPERDAANIMTQYAARCPAGQTPYSEGEALTTCHSAYSSPAREPAESQSRRKTEPAPAPLPPRPMSAGELMTQYPELREPVIHDLLREAEIMNLIAASKVGKSWLVLSLALCIATGRIWLGRFQVRQGDVLLIDNELHPQTLSRRLKTVAAAMGVVTDEYAARLYVEPLRGRLQDLYALGRYFDGMEPGRYRLVVLDAFYRFLPAGTDENDNGAMAHLYNVLDAHAQRLQCAFVLIHHASKGSQADKSVTDVGAGAGSMARATDTHLILRPHEEDGVVVLDGAARSWPPVKPMCLRWAFPIWQPDEAADPTLLHRPGKKRGGATDADKPELTPELFVAKYLSAKPLDRMAIIAKAGFDGVSARKADGLLRLAVADGLAHEWRGSTRCEPTRFGTEPNPGAESSRSRAQTPPHPRRCENAPRGRVKGARANTKKRGAA